MTMRELLYALRRLRGSPMFTIGATVTMALAIGATASVFGLVDGVLLKAFPFREPNRVLVVSESNPGRHFPLFSVTPANYLDWRADNRTFDNLVAAEAGQAIVTGRAEPERVTRYSVTPNFFTGVDVTLALGRGLTSDSAGPPEAVIGYGYWQRRYGGARSVLGQTLTADDRPALTGEPSTTSTRYTIVGVMPPGMPTDFDLWTRLSFTGAEEAERGAHRLVVFGRLKPGVTPQAAQADLEAIARRLAVAYPQTNEGWSVRTAELLDRLFGPMRPALLALLAADACVLLIGAANLANLFLVRCVSRDREMALRTALGAARGRLARELLCEAMCLGVAAGMLGAGVAVIGVRALRSLAPATLPRLGQIGVDGRVLGFCALASVVTILLFGTIPAWRASGANLAGVLKTGAKGTGSAGDRGWQNVFVVLQVAIALVLLTSASLLAESFRHFELVDLGFRPDGVMSAEIELPAGRYAAPARQVSFVDGVVSQLAAMPGLEASAASSVPGRGAPSWAFSVVGEPPPDPGHVAAAGVVAVNPSFFHTMGVTLQRGRGVLPADDQRTAKVVVVDDVLAHRFFSGRDPIGQRLSAAGDTLQIVGVVGAVRQDGLNADDRPTMYIALSQFPDYSATLVVRSRASDAAAAAIRRAVAAVDPSVPVFNFETMNHRLAQSIGPTRFSTFLASLFAITALILSVVGIYSVLAYIVAQDRREIGIRLALGARGTHVMGHVVRRGLMLTGAGLALGAATAWIVTRSLATLFVGVSPHDPTAFVGVALLFALVALLAASVPAFRTTRVDPVVALNSP
jgi:putative ABC transport system permease protein